MKLTTARLDIIRHGESAGNARQRALREDPRYHQFHELYRQDLERGGALSKETLQLAEQLGRTFEHHRAPDWKLPLTETGKEQARATALGLREQMDGQLPDAVLISTHKRAVETYRAMRTAWQELPSLRNDNLVFMEPSLREAEIGKASMYGMWELFFALNAPEHEYRVKEGHLFSYRFPNGENLYTVMDRILPVINMINEEFAGRRVWIIAHHLINLTLRARYENWIIPEEYMKQEEKARSINCGVTTYLATPGQYLGKKQVPAQAHRIFY